MYLDSDINSMKCYFNKFIGVILLSLNMLGLSGNTYAAETACNNNGGAGWPITDLNITNLLIPFNFGDVAEIFDLDISTDISHTYIGDLTVRVTSPESATQVLIFERPGTAATDTAPIDTGPYGCNLNDIVATFDDEAVPAVTIENVCPVVTGTSFLSVDALSVFDGEDPNGNWGFYFSDSANQDQGTLNEACITASFAAVTFDKWVSTNNTCSDTLDTLSIAPGTDVYFCYTVLNPSTETFTINPGDVTDDQGHDISALETTYLQNDSQTVVVGPITAGSAALPNNSTTVNNATVTATFATPNFTGTLVTGESATAVVGDPVFNTSTKTVAGSTQAGFMLEYTITINETAGIYTPNVQVTDIVDANLSGIVFTTLPAGSTNNTVGNAIDITNIIVPANGSESIVFTAFIGASVPAGTNIDNTATIDHAASGVTFDAIAPTVIVTTIPPASGIKQLYFEDLDNNPLPMYMTRVAPTVDTRSPNGTNFTIDHATAPFVKAFTITGSSTVNVQLRIRRRNGGGSRSIDVDLYNGNTGTFIAQGTDTWNNGNWVTRIVPINIPAGGANFTVGDYVQVVITETSGNGNIKLRSEVGGTTILSEVQMQTSTVINIDSVTVYNAGSGLEFSSYEAGTQVSIQAVVSDPFGSADITSATISITDSAATPKVTNAAMTSITTTAATRTYEYIYTIPSAPAPDGFWNINITANEGNEGTISHSSAKIMVVGSPDITLAKTSNVVADTVNSNNYKAIPGATVEYTVSVENAGYGYIDTDSFIIDDPIPAGTRLYLGPPGDTVTFTDGATSSGLSFNFIDINSVIDDVEFYNNNGTTIVNTPTADGNGVDTTSPRIDMIKILPKNKFNGGDTVNNPSAVFKFNVVVD